MIFIFFKLVALVQEWFESYDEPETNAEQKKVDDCLDANDTCEEETPPRVGWHLSLKTKLLCITWIMLNVCVLELLK